MFDIRIGDIVEVKWGKIKKTTDKRKYIRSASFAKWIFSLTFFLSDLFYIKKKY